MISSHFDQTLCTHAHESDGSSVLLSSLCTLHLSQAVLCLAWSVGCNNPRRRVLSSVSIWWTRYTGLTGTNVLCLIHVQYLCTTKWSRVTLHAVYTAVCEYIGQTYNPGDSFPSCDGPGVTHGECQWTWEQYFLFMHAFTTSNSICSFCSASGHVACTERACIQKCKCIFIID